MTDSELATLQEKVKRLTHDRDVALKMADRTNKLLKELTTQKEEYAKLLADAETRIHLLEVLRGDHMPKKPKRSIHDWIWTALFAGLCAAVIAIFGGFL